MVVQCGQMLGGEGLPTDTEAAGGAVGGEQLGALNVALLAGHEKRCVAIPFRLIHSHAHAQQHGGHLGGALLAGEEQRHRS